MPSILVPPPCCFGISTARTGGESTSPMTSDSRSCTGCPADLIRSQRWTARPPLALPDSSLPPGTPPRLPTSRSQTTSPVTSTGSSTPPGERPVDQTPTVTSDPAPSLHPYYRGFSTTTGRSADMPRDGTQLLTVFAAWSAPSRTRAGMQCRGMTSHVPYKSSRSGSRHLHAGHRLASKTGNPPDSSRSKGHRPGSDVT